MSRSLSVTRKSPSRRKLSNSVSRQKSQGSAELINESGKQKTQSSCANNEGLNNDTKYYLHTLHLSLLNIQVLSTKRVNIAN